MEKQQRVSGSGPGRAAGRSKRLRRSGLLCLLALLCLTPPYLLPFLSKSSFFGGRQSHTDDSWCPLPEVAIAHDDALKPSEHLMSSEQLDLQVKRLSAAVRIPTESFDDNGDVDEDPRWAPFGDFHRLLEQLFPLVHSRLELRKVNRYGLLYSFKGTNTALKPILLTAHQDVVPAGAASHWTYPPFAGHYDGTFLWGRGSADCKNVLVGILSTLEDLLSQSFVPHRTIVLAFGFDEETSGLQGAAKLNQTMVEEWGPDAFLLVLDEGGMGVQTLGDVLYAYPGVGEKGYYDIQLRLDVQGGHSSKPPAHTAIGIMADAILALESKPYAPRLPHWSPFRRVLECRAKYSAHSVQPWLRDALLSGDEKDIAERLSAEPSNDKWLMKTSQAVDVINGGVKVNALPESVQLLVNHRVALHESVQYVNEHAIKVLVPIAQKHDLHLRAFGADKAKTNATGDTTAGILQLSAVNTLDPAPLSPTDNSVWALFSGTLRYVFESTESGHGKTVVPVGNIMTGNTDTMHYWNLTRNIYRYSPARDGIRLNVHAIDERMDMTAHLEGMRVYYDLICNFDCWDEE